MLKVMETIRYTLTLSGTCGTKSDAFFAAPRLTDFFHPVVPRDSVSHRRMGSGTLGETGRTAMDVLKMLAELRQERDQLEEAILTLERLARGRGRRRGRPPAWMTELKRRGRPPGSKNKTKESTAA